MSDSRRSNPSKTLLITAICLLSACTVSAANFEVDALYDDRVDFTSFKTFRWRTGTRDDSPVAAQIDERIKRATEAELAKHGMRLAKPEETPDLLLTYYGGIEDNLQLEGVRFEVAPRVVWTGAAPLDVTRAYRVGTLVLDFADAETETVVWSGVVTTKASTSSRLRERVEKAVQKVLRQYPPK